MSTTESVRRTAEGMCWPTVENGSVSITRGHIMYIKGNPRAVARPRGRAVVITGARASTAYGDRVAADFAASLTERGHVIWTGGAFGIDAAATRAALAAGGTPVVLTATGADAGPYPSAHRELFEQVIEARGAIVSLESGEAGATRARFLDRGKVLGSLAGAVIIVEAGVRSGALTVAAAARRAERPVYAVPGPITSAASAGNHHLIRNGGARILTDTTDLHYL